MENTDYNKIDEFIEKRVHAHSQALEKVVFSMQKDLKGIRDDLPIIVKETVNGKIDNIAKHLTMIDKKLDQLKPVSQLVTVTQLARRFLIWAAPLTGIGALIKWIIR